LHFTCFTGTNVQILTQKKANLAGCYAGDGGGARHLDVGAGFFFLESAFSFSFFFIGGGARHLGVGAGIIL
jgi:hypothetical protein